MNWFKRALGKGGRAQAPGLVTQGVVHAREGRLDEARKLYQAAVDADESLAVARLNLGLCHLDLFNRDGHGLDEGDRKAALDTIASALERALVLDGSAWMGWRALAHVHERRGKWAKAEDAWQRFVQMAPLDAPDRVHAPRALQALAGKARADRARQRALAALDTGVEAHERAVALAALLPLLDDAAVGDVLTRGCALAGTLARRLNDPAQARALLERAVVADARDIEALRELASVALEQGDLPRALAASLAAYREDPADAGLVCNVGVCHLSRGDVEKAAEYIVLAERLDPNDPIVQRAKAALARSRQP